MPTPATPIPRGKPGGPKGAPKGGGFANMRIAGVKAPIVLVGLAVAIAIGLYIRSRAANSSGTATAAPAAADTGAGSGGASGSATDPATGLADAIWGLTGILGGGQFSSPSSGAVFGEPPNFVTAPTAQDLSAYQNADLARSYPSLTAAQQEALFPLGAPIVGPAATPATANGTSSGITIPILHSPSSTPTVPVGKATNVQPFGGITSVKTLANGAKLTTYASGRQVEQAPGKSAYVVKK